MGHHEMKNTVQKLAKAITATVMGFVLSISVSGSASAAELNVPIDETKAFVLEKQ